MQAILCVRGRDLLYWYCSEHEIPHKQISKLIVATRTSEVPKLNELLIRGVQNGVEGLRMVDGNEAMRMEPELQCVKALLSPLSGIVDSHSLMLSLVVSYKSMFESDFKIAKITLIMFKTTSKHDFNHLKLF